MDDLISRQDAIDAIEKLDIQEDMCVFEILSHIELVIGTLPSAQQWIPSDPTSDVVEVVRCKDCKHRIVNEHYGEKGYMKLKAICDKDTGDPFELGRNAEDDEWFCADAERREAGNE